MIACCFLNIAAAAQTIRWLSYWKKKHDSCRYTWSSCTDSGCSTQLSSVIVLSSFSLENSSYFYLLHLRINITCGQNDELGTRTKTIYLYEYCKQYWLLLQPIPKNMSQLELGLKAKKCSINLGVSQTFDPSQNNSQNCHRLAQDTSTISCKQSRNSIRICLSTALPRKKHRKGLNNPMVFLNNYCITIHLNKRGSQGFLQTCFQVGSTLW